MVIHMAMFLVLVEKVYYSAAVAAEQVPRLATANTSKTCCGDHVRNIAAAHIT